MSLWLFWVCGISIDWDLKMKQNGILEAHILQDMPLEAHAFSARGRSYAALKISLFYLTRLESLTYLLPIDSITNKGPQTNLVTWELFPVAMTSFRSAASLMLEPLMNICYYFLPEKEMTEG